MEIVLNTILSRITNAQNEMLLEIFKEEKIVKVVKEMNPAKAPGVDGLPALFYRFLT